MSVVRVGENESLESALKRFKRKCQKDNILGDLRKKEFYEKPSVRRKKKSEAARKRSGIYAYGRRQRLLGKRRHGAYDFVKIRLACDVAAGNADHDFAPKPAHGIVKNLRVIDSSKPLAHFFALKRRGRQLLQKLKLCAVIARSHAAQSARDEHRNRRNSRQRQP